MKQVMTRYKVLMLVLVLMVPVLSACGLQVAADDAEQDTDVTSYDGALDLSYEGALDATSQLALGTLQLEDTDLAVTETQASDLLALWQVLTSGELQGDGETNAVLNGIEAAMSGEQVSAIAGLRLTQEDAQAWLEESGSAQAGDTSAGQAAASQTLPGTQRPEGVEELTDEEREQMRAQMQAQMEAQGEGVQTGTFAGSMGTGALGGLSSRALTGAVVELLTERSGSVDTQARAPDGESQPEASTAQEAAQETTTEVNAPQTAVEPESTSGSESASETEQTEQTEVVEPEASESEAQPESSETDPTESDVQASVSHTVHAGESLASIAAAYGVTVASIVEVNEIQDANLIEIGQELLIPDPSKVPDAANAGTSIESETPVVPIAVVATPALALEELEDTDPGPPLTIEVSANRATQDPLVEQSQQYLVTGVVRNGGEETYAVSSILATFFDAKGFRGTIDRQVRDGQVVSTEWNWHGQTEAEFAALLLAPGEEWPFSVEITAQDMASFLLHPDAVATERESAPVVLSGVQVVDEGTGYLRISGTATNANAFAIKNVTATGVLLDANGQIVSLGSTYVLDEDIAPGESVRFDVRVAKEPYVGYELYAQAERDWQ
jgi:LysM repeat protein